MITAEQVSANLERVRNRIADAGGDPTAITVVGVTKAFDAPVAAAALAAGLVDLGENYAQQLLAKVQAFEMEPPANVARWHFIGGLQRNKVRQLAGHVHCYQSVDRPQLGAEIAKRDPGATVLIQVNATGEIQKSGMEPSGVADLASQLTDRGLAVAGLMAVGRAGDDPGTERAFAETVALADRLDLPVRSLGMSADLETAVRAGTTMVRIGRDLFGARPDSRLGPSGVGDS